jgi:hypothetical protein
MRSTLFALALTALTIVWWPTAPAIAEDARIARGTIVSMDGRSLVVSAAGHEMTFSIDSKTIVEARGGSTKSARAAAAGKPGPKLDEVLQTGQAVAVTYNDVAGTLHATEIKAIPKPGAANAMRSSGVVKSLGGDWITIQGNSGSGASFEQTFKVDASTRVFKKGAGTAAAAKGGRAPFNELIASGDHVSVGYHKSGDALVASDVRVTMKATTH